MQSTSEADTAELLQDIPGWAVVCYLPLGKEDQLVKAVKELGGRLVYTCDDCLARLVGQVL